MNGEATRPIANQSAPEPFHAAICSAATVVQIKAKGRGSALRRARKLLLHHEQQVRKWKAVIRNLNGTSKPSNSNSANSG